MLFRSQAGTKDGKPSGSPLADRRGAKPSEANTIDDKNAKRTGLTDHIAQRKDEASSLSKPIQETKKDEVKQPGAFNPAQAQKDEPVQQPGIFRQVQAPL